MLTMFSIFALIFLSGIGAGIYEDGVGKGTKLQFDLMDRIAYENDQALKDAGLYEAMN